MKTYCRPIAVQAIKVIEAQRAFLLAWNALRAYKEENGTNRRHLMREAKRTGNVLWRARNDMVKVIDDVEFAAIFRD